MQMIENSQQTAKKTFDRVMMNGNQAVAWGAISAGVDYFAHYPGSPVNMVEPELKKIIRKYDLNVTINDSLNEHIAALSCTGASFCGARSLVVMKHVGVNIAADPFNYIGYTGVKGGMVIVVGTDPGANSSTGEEDTHWYAPQFNFPLFEPTSVREVYSFVNKAYDLSEKFQLPVMIFIPSRLCYNSDLVEVPNNPKKSFDKISFNFKKNESQYINVGKRAVRNHRLLLERIDKLAKNCRFIKKFFNEHAEFGMITRGLTFGHCFESIKKLGIGTKVHLLNIDMVYPLNKEIIKEFFVRKKEVLIIEDQDGFLELSIKGMLFNEKTCPIYGKEKFLKYGETTFEEVYKILQKTFHFNVNQDEHLQSVEEVPERLGTFCEGCPHRASFYAIEQALKGLDGIVGGDIGCSSLPPFRADWLMCMNAGIGISQGICHVCKDQTVISTGGESTFFHGGIISLQNAVLNKIPLLHIVFDNQVIGMTGRQNSPTTLNKVNYKKMLKSIGVRRLSVVSAYRPRRLIKILKREISKNGVRVIWVKTPCMQTPTYFTKLKQKALSPYIDSELCYDCSLCYDKLACPAISQQNNKEKTYKIDTSRCQRCGTCRDICPNGAIKASFKFPLTELYSDMYKLIRAPFKEV